MNKIINFFNEWPHCFIYLIFGVVFIFMVIFDPDSKSRLESEHIKSTEKVQLEVQKTKQLELQLEIEKLKAKTQ